MTALLIIDMQRGSFVPYTIRYNAWAVIERINRLSAHFREQQLPVIFIQHDGTKEDAFIPGTEEWKLLPELKVQPGDLFVSKTANDAFYASGLEQLLSGMQVEKLLITGCATDFCVDSTVKSALSKNYGITVAGDAHTTADRPHAAAPALIAHYNWLWADMTPTRYRIRVASTENVLAENARGLF